MITTIDLSILDWIQNHLRCGLLDKIVPVITMLGEAGWIWILLALCLLIPRKTRKYGLAVSLALVLDLLLCNVLLKPLVARPRPYTHRPDIVLLVKKLRDYSFPSGHAAASFAAASALAFSRWRHWRPAMVLAVLISLSRLYLYVHYPSDVLCGALLGTLCGLIGAFWSKKVMKKCRKTTK